MASSNPRKAFCIANVRAARMKWKEINESSVVQLRRLSIDLRLSVSAVDLLLLNGHRYVTHTGLIRLANRRRCTGIEVQSIPEFSDALNRRYAFKAIVYKSKKSAGFTGYGDADPSNVSSPVHGAEMRVAETRAVNRALRKAYGIGICSVEEVGSSAEPPQPRTSATTKGEKPEFRQK